VVTLKQHHDCAELCVSLTHAVTCPGYLFGTVGKVVGIVGGVVDQDIGSRHNAEGPSEPVYR